MPVVERTLTEMLRSSGEVLRQAERHDVVLRRRDGADVMLVDLEREQSLRRSLADLARIIASLQGAPDVLTDRVAETLPAAIPWTSFLPGSERVAFLREFSTTASACIETGVFEPLGQLDREWRATAAVYADPRLLEELQAPADDEALEVPRPKV